MNIVSLRVPHIFRDRFEGFNPLTLHRLATLRSSSAMLMRLDFPERYAVQRASNNRLCANVTGILSLIPASHNSSANLSFCLRGSF
jgi:hypothetical protein